MRRRRKGSRVSRTANHKSSSQAASSACFMCVSHRSACTYAMCFFIVVAPLSSFRCNTPHVPPTCCPCLAHMTWAAVCTHIVRLFRGNFHPSTSQSRTRLADRGQILDDGIILQTFGKFGLRPWKGRCCHKDRNYPKVAEQSIAAFPEKLPKAKNANSEAAQHLPNNCPKAAEQLPRETRLGPKSANAGRFGRLLRHRQLCVTTSSGQFDLVIQPWHTACFPSLDLDEQVSC